MHTTVGQISIIDLLGQIDRKELVINRDYQRQAGVWPDSARTYFIDTILEGYPFPKIYIYQSINEKTRRPIKEIVDGQQRITTLHDFYNGKFKLSSASKNYAGVSYNDLDDETKISFQMYQVETSLILSASRGELLEMFRRINAYTAPLSSAEKRHSLYQGDMKWFVVEQTDEFSDIFEKFKILTPKEISRMGDAEAIADMVTNLEYGIREKSASIIDKLYKTYDNDFKKADLYHQILKDFFDLLSGPLSELSDTFIMKSYVVHSLFSAYTLLKYGLPAGSVAPEFNVQPNPQFKINTDRVIPKLRELAEAHELQETNGRYGEYVKSCISSTTKLAQRRTRVSILKDVLMS